MTEPKSLGGLVNLGLTCYANAVLQCMRHCKKLPWLFEEGRYTRILKSDAPLTKSYAEVITLLGSCRRGQSVRPADFLKKFRDSVRGTGFDELASLAPHDSYEFYICLLDRLHESLAQEVEMKISYPNTTDLEKRCVQALEVWKGEFSKKFSPFVDLFYGLLYFITECQTCHNKSYRWEPTTTIKGVVDPSKSSQTLEEMIKGELVPEEISGYHCDHCTERQTAVRTTYIWKLPRYVVVVLKRFGSNGQRINTPLSMESHKVSFKAFMTPDSPETSSAQDYTLCGMVDHHGGAQGGHYTAQCNTNGAWQVYDDESSNPIEKPIIGRATYMMWFEVPPTS